MDHLLIHKVEVLASVRTGTEDGTPTYADADPLEWPNGETFGPGRLDSPREGQPRPGQKPGSIIYKSTLLVYAVCPVTTTRQEVRVTTEYDAKVWNVDQITPADGAFGTHHLELAVSRIVDP